MGIYYFIKTRGEKENMGKTPKGVRQVNENVVQPGRALIVTNENFGEFDWNEIPNGSLHIDGDTGVMSVKLSGETTWVPAGIKNDGTLVISRDTQFNVELFTVTSINKEEGSFIYENAKGQQRYKQVDDEGFIFEIEDGTYLMKRNHIEVTIDSVLTRTVMNGGIKELSERRIKVLDDLVVGQTVSIKYVKWVRIGNPYPRIFLNSTKPESPEVGDFWLDPNGSLTEGSLNDQIKENPTMSIPWRQITGTPSTLAGYGIKDIYATKGHTHRTLDIADFPSSLPANGGDSSTVKGKEPGLGAGNLLVLNGAGGINTSMLSENYIQESGVILFQDTRPTDPKNNSLWVCTGSNPHIEAYTNYEWISLT